MNIADTSSFVFFDLKPSDNISTKANTAQHKTINSKDRFTVLVLTGVLANREIKPTINILNKNIIPAADRRIAKVLLVSIFLCDFFKSVKINKALTKNKRIVNRNAVKIISAILRLDLRVEE